MNDILLLGMFIVGYILLTRVILPKLGVPT